MTMQDYKFQSDSKEEVYLIDASYEKPKRVICEFDTNFCPNCGIYLGEEEKKECNHCKQKLLWY